MNALLYVINTIVNKFIFPLETFSLLICYYIIIYFSINSRLFDYVKDYLIIFGRRPCNVFNTQMYLLWLISFVFVTRSNK